jgi:hypothetical protein
MEVIMLLAAIAAGVFSLILSIKVWKMTGHVRELRDRFVSDEYEEEEDNE